MTEGGGRRRLNRDDAVLVLAGAALMVSTWTLLRQTKLAILSLERAMLIHTLSYFAGVSAGYAVAHRFSRPFVANALLALAVAQVALGLTLQALALELGRWLPAVGVELAIFALVSVASTTLFAVFLPAISAERDGDLTWCYVIEVAGSLAGLLAVAWMADGGQAAVSGLLGALALATAALLGARPLALGVTAAALLALTLGYAGLDRRLALHAYQRRNPSWQVTGVAHQRYTPYQKIEVLETGQGRRLVLDGRSHASESTFANYAYFAAEYPASLLTRPRVAILGCGSMATVGRIGARAAAIDIVDIDRGVFETSSVFFEPLHHASALTNWKFHHDDAKHYLANHTGAYDLIVHDIPPARTRQTALTYTSEFLQVVKARLAPGGIFSLPSLVSVHARSRYGRKLVRTMASVFEHVWVLQHGGSSYLFGSDRVTRRADALAAAIRHPAASRVRVIAGPEIGELGATLPVVHIGNLSELIDE